MINDNKTHYKATITAKNISTIAELLQKITIKTMGINCNIQDIRYYHRLQQCR